MSDDTDRRAQILANAQRRAQQSQAAPVPNPSPAEDVPQGQPARAWSDNKDVQIRVVPRGTKPSSAGRNKQARPGVVTIAPKASNPGAGNIRVSSPRPGSGSGSVTVRGGSGAPNTGARVTTVNRAPSVAPVQQAPAAMLQSNAPQIDLSVMLAYQNRGNLVATQQRHLAAQTVRPVGVAVWINPGPTSHLGDAAVSMLSGVALVRSSTDMGPWMRWSVAAQCVTEFVAILDDDCLPGPQWLQSAFERLQGAGEHDIIVAAGKIYDGDFPEEYHLLGPENPPLGEEQVDLGRCGWIMRTETARRIAMAQRFGEVLSTEIHIASIVKDLGGTQILLPYAADRRGWGMLEAPRTENSTSTSIAQYAAAGEMETPESIRAILYYAYRDNGWMPICVAAAQDTVRTEKDEVAQ